MDSNPLVVYGRLLEAFHLSGYAFERAYSELEYMLADGRWLATGFSDVHAFIASIDLSKFKHSVEQRKRFAGLLKDAEVSQRATAKMLGVDEKTIRNDRAELSAPPREIANEINSGTPAAAELSAPSEWWQDSSVDPAKLAQRQAGHNQRDVRREEKLAEINAANTNLETGEKRYPVVYADPPWRYENPPIGASGRSIENHYPTMTLEEICALPVGEIAASDAILYLWATAPKLAECLQVITAWDFTYRTNLVWDKQVIGMGYHARNQHELLLVARRGQIPPPAAGTQPASLYSERRGEHSAKPIFFYEMIERTYPGCAKLELFARAERSGWDRWGNQAAEVRRAV
jgi:N6-adenosine-specific RNA methylase IME4